MIHFGDLPPRLHSLFLVRHSVKTTPDDSLGSNPLQLSLFWTLRGGVPPPFGGGYHPLGVQNQLFRGLSSRGLSKWGLSQSFRFWVCAQSKYRGVGSLDRAQWIGGDPIFVTPPQSQPGPHSDSHRQTSDLYFRDLVIRGTSTKNTSYERSRLHLNPILNRSKKHRFF